MPPQIPPRYGMGRYLDAGLRGERVNDSFETLQAFIGVLVRVLEIDTLLAPRAGVRVVAGTVVRFASAHGTSSPTRSSSST